MVLNRRKRKNVHKYKQNFNLLLRTFNSESMYIMSFFSINDKGTQVFPYNLVLSIINSFLTDESNRIFFDWSSFGHYQRSRDIKYLSYELWLVLVLKVLLATSGTVWPMLCLKFYSLAANTVVQLSPVLLWS